MEIRQRSQIPTDFFSDGYRLSGTIDARRHSLADMLYDASSEYVTLNNAYLSTIQNPADILSSYGVALIMKGHLTFALTPHQDNALRHDQKRSQFQRPRYRQLTLIVPFFEIRGKMWLPGPVDPRAMINTQQKSFITMLEVTARATADPTITYEGAGALINATKISFMGLDKL